MYGVGSVGICVRRYVLQSVCVCVCLQVHSACVCAIVYVCLCLSVSMCIRYVALCAVYVYEFGSQFAVFVCLHASVYLWP